MTLKDIILEIKPDRIYIIISPTARTDFQYPAKGYAGPSGRIDEIARSILSLTRPSSLIIAILMGPPNPPVTIIYYRKPSCIFMSEREVVYSIRKAPKDSTCIRIEYISARDIVSLLAGMGYKIMLLSEQGVDISELKPKMPRLAFLLGAHVDIPKHIIEDVEGYIVNRVSIGPLSYQASQVIAYLEWEAEACK